MKKKKVEQHNLYQIDNRPMSKILPIIIIFIWLTLIEKYAPLKSLPTDPWMNKSQMKNEKNPVEFSRNDGEKYLKVA